MEYKKNMIHIPIPHRKCQVCNNVISCNTKRLIDKIYPYACIFYLGVVWRIGVFITEKKIGLMAGWEIDLTFLSNIIIYKLIINPSLKFRDVRACGDRT